MAEASYTRKAVEEVYRLADERVATIDTYLAEKNNEYSLYCKDSEVTTAEINDYFQNLTKQLDRWKQHYNQIVADAYRKQDKQYLALRDELIALSSKLNIPRDKRRSCASQAEANDTIFTIHNTLAKVEEVRQSCDEFINQCCVSLRFVGKLNLEEMQSEEIGVVEFLADSACAEILPINVPRVKLGGLFHVNFRLTRSHCPASKKHVTHKVTRDNTKTGERTKITSYLFDQKDGKFSLGFPITSIVPHTVTIEYMGKNIKNSPYTIVFKAGTGSSSSNAVGDSNNNNSMSLRESTPVNNTNGGDVSSSLFGDRFGANESKESKSSSSSSNYKHTNDLENSRPLGHKLARLSLISTETRDMEIHDENKENGSESGLESASTPKRNYSGNLPTNIKTSPKAMPNINSSMFNNTNHSFSNYSSDESLLKSPPSNSIKPSEIKTSPIDPGFGRTNLNFSKNAGKGEKLKVVNGKLKARQICEIKSKFHYPIGCGSGRDNEVFICDTGHGLVHQYDSEYTLKNTFGKRANLHRPSKCLFDHEESMLLVKDDREIYQWDLRSDSIVRRFEVRPKSNLYGLLLCENTREIMTLEANTSTLHFLSMRDPGNRRSESYAPLLSLNSAEKRQSKCRFMDFNSNGDLICSDLGMSQIYLTTISGVSLSTFGGCGTTPGLFCEPSGVTSDMAGNVLIADSKHNRIQIFDDLGNYVGFVESDQRNRRPSDILLARNNSHLLVMNYLDQLVRVYSL